VDICLCTKNVHLSTYNHLVFIGNSLFLYFTLFLLDFVANNILLKLQLSGPNKKKKINRQGKGVKPNSSSAQQPKEKQQEKRSHTLFGQAQHEKR